MPKVPSFEELQQSDKYVPSFEELQKAEAALYGTPEEFGEQDVTDKTLGQKALKFLQNIPAAQAAGLMPIAAKGLAGIPEAPFQFASQFAKEPGEAPTMEEVMSVAGVPQTPIPIPEIEPGLGISIPTSAMAKMAEKLSGIKAPEFPETAPATEVAAQAALMATDPTLVLSGAKEAIGPAISGAYKTGKELTKLGAGATAGLVGAPLPSLNGQTFGRAAEFAGKAYGGTEKAFQAMENVPKLVAQEWKNLKPSIKPKFVEQYELANQVGINPDLLAENARLIYGPDAFVTKAKASKSALTPALEAQKFDQLQVEVSNALVNQAEKVSNGRLSAPNKVATGEAIRKGWDDAVSNLFEEANLRYSHLPKEIPSGALDRNSSEAFYSILGKLEEQEQKSLKYASTAAAKKPHAANIEAIQSIRNNIFETVPKEETFVGKFLRTIQGKVQPTERVFVGDLGQAIDQLQQIGREAYSSQSFFGMSEIPANKSLLKNLYGDLKSVILETVKKEKPELLDELIKSNKKQAEFFEKNKFIGDIIQNEKKAPEEVYNELIKSANSNRLNAVKDILGNTEAIDYIKGQVLFDLLESKSVANVPLYNNVNKIMKSENFGRIKNTLFDKGDSDLFERVIELGQDIGAREFNPSRSGIVVKALEYLQKPITGIKAAVTGKTMTDLLESQAYRDYFKDEPLQYIFERRVRGGFNENLLDDVIVERLKEPTIKKEFETAINQGRVPKSLQDAYIEVGKKESPINRYSALKSMATYASKFTDQVTPNNTTIAYRTLQAANHVNKIKYGPEKNVPIFIPEEDRESVITSIKDSKMSSIQKAKNVRNINQYGYLLDIRGFDGEEKEPIQKLLIEKEIIKPSESKSIKQDRPDILKKLEEKESK